jgi:transcriptional regulator with XRE-family HTH domain
MRLKIRELRKKINMSPQKLAELLDISAEELKGYESGKSNPSPDMIVDIADALRTRPDVLLGYSSKPKIIYEVIEEEHKATVYLITDRMKCTGATIKESGSVTLMFSKEE